MLPGFRFLFAAIVLSLSILIFGLGAAALLCAAHEQFASMPSRRATPEPVFARQNDAAVPTLALLRFDPPVAAIAFDNVPATTAPEIVAPAEQAADTAPAEPEKLAALKPEEPMPAEAAKPEIRTNETAAATPVVAEAPVANDEVKLAAIAATLEPSTAPASTAAASTAAASTTDGPSLEGDIAATKIATLGGPAVTIDENTSANATDAQPDRSVARKRAAQRARERRRIAARRARLARLAAEQAALQLQANPFGQTQAPTPVARATR